VYQKLRENAIKVHNLQNEQDDEGRPEADFFHDGSKVLDAIQHWHNAVRQYIRQTDNLTGQILDLVTQSMLQGDPSQRISATNLCTRLTSILDSCLEKPEFGALPDVQQALNEVQSQNEQLHAQDLPEPSSQREGPIQGRAARDARKSYNVHMARMRSEYFGAPAASSFLWPSTSIEQSKARVYQGRLPVDSAANQGLKPHSSHPSTTQLGTSAEGGATSHPKRPLSAQMKRSSTSNQRKTQDVFQARHELDELAAKQRISGRFKEMITSNRKKDPFLAEFFQNRDIVSLSLEPIGLRSKKLITDKI
jgi:hypothetical protein